MKILSQKELKKIIKYMDLCQKELEKIIIENNEEIEYIGNKKQINSFINSFVRKDSTNLKHIIEKYQSNNVVSRALKKDINSIRYIKNINNVSDDVLLMVIKRDPYLIIELPEERQNIKLLIYSFKLNPNIIHSLSKDKKTVLQNILQNELIKIDDMSVNKIMSVMKNKRKKPILKRLFTLKNNPIFGS